MIVTFVHGLHGLFYTHFFCICHKENMDSSLMQHNSSDLCQDMLLCKFAIAFDIPFIKIDVCDNLNYVPLRNIVTMWLYICNSWARLLLALLTRDENKEDIIFTSRIVFIIRYISLYLPCQSLHNTRQCPIKILQHVNLIKHRGLTVTAICSDNYGICILNSILIQFGGRYGTQSIWKWTQSVWKQCNLFTK